MRDLLRSHPSSEFCEPVKTTVHFRKQCLNKTAKKLLLILGNYLSQRCKIYCASALYATGLKSYLPMDYTGYCANICFELFSAGKYYCLS